jgi:hypothetical protein
VRDIPEGVNEGIRHLTQAVDLLRSGDNYRGSAAVMEALGAFGMAAFTASPLGPRGGAILSALTTLISSILEALAPPREGLESKLRRYIREESLARAQTALRGGIASWELAKTRIQMLARARRAAAEELPLIEARIASGGSSEELAMWGEQRARLRRIAAGFSWEYLTQNIGWEEQKARLSMAFAALDHSRDLSSSEWVTLAFAPSCWPAPTLGVPSGPPSPSSRYGGGGSAGSQSTLQHSL